MLVFHTMELREARAKAGHAYREFLRTAGLSAGLYELPAGAEDKQKPHTEDEIYYVVSGRAKFFSDGDGTARHLDVGPGSVIFVGANADHRFHDITEDLVLLVFFGPAEGSRAK
ncbi:MAG TPA: cupin domain-containing protein [Terriglobales bacterium]|nr:cupin domain-containing protein [Terriglobales bacterium]